MKIPRRAANTALIAFLFSVVFYAETAVLVKEAGLHFNTSDSVPIGIYEESPRGLAKYTAICLTLPVLLSAEQLGLRLSHGSCPGGVEPVLKTVFSATALQPIDFTERGFSITGTSLPNTAPKPFSKTGKPLSHYPFGTYTEGLWAISSCNPDSFDSRYFGPVDQAAIRFHATPLLTR